MNLKKTLIVFAVLLLTVSVFAQFSSFRSLSTAGILDGDIEYILVPGEMVYVDGFNVYTNLSNFTGGTESLLSPFSSSNYLIGGKFNYDLFHVAVLHRSNGNMSRWMFNGIDNYYEDLVGNTEYDFHSTDSLIDDDFYTLSSEETYGALTYGDMETMRFGFSYYRDEDQYHEFYDFVNEYNEYNIEFNDWLYNYYEGYYYDYHSSSVEQRFLLSFFQPLNEMEFGVNVFYEPGTSDDYETELDTIAEDRSPNATFVSTYDEIDEFYEHYMVNSMDFGGFFTLRKNTDDYIGEFEAGYTYSMIPQTDTYSADEYFWSFETEPTAFNNWTNEIFDTLTTQGTLSYYESNAQFVSARMKFVKKMEKVQFGVGARFSMSTFAENIIGNSYGHYVEQYDDGDGVADGGDYVYEESGSYAIEDIYNRLYHSIYLPVGVEFFANNSLCFRLGANTTFTWQYSHNSMKYTAVTPITAINTTGDGVITEWIVDDPTMRMDGEDDYHAFSKYTNYYYGLGWNVTDDFSVDIMGFSNLTDLTGWRVSANAKIF